MTSRTHDMAAIGLLSVVVLIEPLRFISLGTAIASIFACLFGGIAPDIDQPTAPLWRNLPIGKYLGRIFDRLTGGHRFLTHSLIGLALFGLLVHYLLSFVHPILGTINIGYVWWSFMLGMFSHLVMDSFTKEGVPWLLPIPIKFGFPPLKKLRITTGKKIETFIVFPLLVMLIIFWLHLKYSPLLAQVHLLFH